MNATIADFLIFANGMILVFLGFIQMSYKRKVLNNYLAILLFSLTGFMILYNWGFKTGFIARAPFLINADIIVSYVLAPCIFLYFRSISNAPMQLFARYWPAFLPGVLVFFFSILYNLAHPEIAAAYFATHPTVPPYLQPNILGHLNTLGDLGVAASFLFAFWANRFLFQRKNLLRSSELRIVFAFIAIMILNSSMVVLAELFNRPGLLLFALNGYGVILIGYSFFTYRYPEFMQIVLREVKTLKYEQSHLQRVNVPQVLKRLDGLMQKEKLYTDVKLSLQQVSQRLEVTSHQLSELLNHHRNLNFRGYLNTFRVEEAKRLLWREPQRTVLDVGFASGFNSKAAFNAVFAELAQCTPSQFRARQAAPPPP